MKSASNPKPSFDNQIFSHPRYVFYREALNQ